MNAKYSISVVVPLYNKEKYIERTLRSILSQTESPSEIIVVDDGSTDRSIQVIDTLKNPLIKVITQPNGGESAARNTGITIAAGEYIAFLDADDEWDPDFLETIAYLIGKYPQAGGYATNYRRKFVDQTRPARINMLSTNPEWDGMMENFFEMFLDEMPITSSSVTIKKEIFKKTGMFKVGIANGADQDMWCRISFQYKFAYSARICATYFKNVPEAITSIMRTCEAPFIEDHKELLEKFPLPEKEQYNLEEYLNKLRLIKAFWAILNNKKELYKSLLEDSKKTKRFKSLWRKEFLISKIPFYVYMAFRKATR